MNLVTTPPSEAEYDYFYVNWHSGIMFGCIVMRQVKHATEAINPDGFNIAAGARFILLTLGFPVIISDWKPITKKRYDEFCLYSKEFKASQSQNTPDNVSYLKLVKNDSEHPNDTH